MKLKPSIIKTLLNAFREGHTIISACKLAGINRASYYRWTERVPKLKLRIENLMENRNSLVRDALYAKALKGDTNACKAWLQNKAGWKFTETKIDVNASANAEANSEAILDPEVARERLQRDVRLIEKYRLLDSERSKN